MAAHALFIVSSSDVNQITFSFDTVFSYHLHPTTLPLIMKSKCQKITLWT